VLDLHRLRLLHEFLHRGSISAVAQALSYSPSTVSQQLATLEKEAGATLLVPAGRGLQLTPQGRQLAAAAGRMLELEEGARSALASDEPGLGPVRVAVFQSATHAIVPGALTLLAERHPGLRVEIAELAPEDGISEVAARGVDLAVAEQYPGRTRERRSDLRRELLGQDAIRLAVADPGIRGLDELHEAAWVMEPVGTAARSWAVQQCRAAGFEPDVRFEAADLIAHIRLVAGGHAVGMLPDMVWAGDDPSVRLLDLPGRPRREIFAASRAASHGRADLEVVRRALTESFAQAIPSGTV
jgi:DNA-binding transcriptional LysR family regulator